MEESLLGSVAGMIVLAWPPMAYSHATAAKNEVPIFSAILITTTGVAGRTSAIKRPCRSARKLRNSDHSSPECRVPGPNYGA